MARTTASLLCVLVAATLHAQQPQPPPKPSFQTSVEVTSLDVSVVDDRGKPVTDLTPGEFSVRIDGAVRRVVSAEWVPLSQPAGTQPPPPPDGYSTNESATGGRLIVVGIDQPNIRFGGALTIMRAANLFIDRLSPSDRIAVAGFGNGAPSTPFTVDRERVKRALSRMVGQKISGRTSDHRYNIALVEAQQIEKGDRYTLETVQNRECAQENTPGGLEMCRSQVEMEARSTAIDANREADQTTNTLRELFNVLRLIDAPKTLILISEGFVLNDEATIVELGRMAAEARTSLYTLKLDNTMFDITEARAPINPFADRQARAEGLEMLAGAARGTLFTITGTGQNLFERIESELSGYYLLGIESEAKDKDGKSHTVRVDVPRRGAIVRSRRQLLNTAADLRTLRASRSPRQSVAAALISPLVASALPLRVASFALQGPERDRVQILIHADVGTDYPASKVVSLGYVITDQNGRMVDSKATDMRLLPVMNGVPSALQFTAGASLPPGDYTLKLGAAEGDRVGTVEHVIHAALPAAASNLTLSELMVGGPADVGELLTPTIGYQVTFGTVHGYVEAYGQNTDGVTMEYEIAVSADAPALVNVDVPPRAAGDTRMIFSRTIPVHQVPPGKYVLRAILSANGRSIKTLTRGFEIAAPKVLLTSADGLGDNGTAVDLYLPIDDKVMAPPFRRDSAVDKETVAPFRERLTDAIKAPFEQGVAFLGAGDPVKAEGAFKKAIDPDGDSTAPLAFLAAAFADAGHDREAASAWQTALVNGTDFPQIYHWLGEALLRNHDFGEARAIYEEAAGKWPADARFTKPLAMLYGTFGKGREAVRTLERYLDVRDDDRDAHYYAVQWFYTVHAGGAVVHNRAEDVKRAKEYADQYARLGGTQLALVKQWVEYLQNEKP